ncbi:MAG TPA: glycosyltransferase [Thermoanaerobaculia bacterium]|jgi:GT2 family glycosyltransferase
MKLTVAIPTYNRGAILVDTIDRLLALTPPADEIVIVDQTREHPPAIDERLAAWNAAGEIRHIRLPEPSIPHAMNVALEEARGELVLFLDDDLIPGPSLVAEHRAAYRDESIWACAGQVLQPGETPCPGSAAPGEASCHPERGEGLPATGATPGAAHAGRGSFAPLRMTARETPDLDFRFNSDTGTFITNVMAGNLSVRREHALSIGGFDENYIGAAYRFESDFALRLTAAGGRIWFEPRASIRHLKLATGGLRALGDHRSTMSPAHAVGDYYFALTHRTDFARYALTRMRQNILTRWHLRHPWAIPTKLIGELRGLFLARRLKARGNVRRGRGLRETTR